MANINILDALGASKFTKSSGAGSSGDPFIPEHLESNSAAMLTALQTIDNMIAGNEAQVDVITLPALPTGTNTIGNVGIARTASTSYVGTVTASGDTTIIAAPGVGLRYRVLSWSFWNETATATKATLKTATINIDSYYMLSQSFGKNGQLQLNEDLVLGTNQAILMNLSVATTVGYSIRVQVI
jgi:hypothetical protein